MQTATNIRVVSNTTNKEGLVTVALTNGHVTVQCADMLFFDDEDLGSTFCEWLELAKEQDSGCVIM